ncbi:MAG: hypothetical protein AAF191_07675, partial [Verrucomicrobiota bacterium]
QVREDLWEWIPKSEEMMKEVNAYLPEAYKKKHGHWEEEKASAEKELGETQARFAALEKSEEGTPGEMAFLQERMFVQDDRVKRLVSHEPTKASVKKYLMIEHDPLLAGKYNLYFDAGYHASFVRLGAYTIVFIVIVGLLRRWSLQTDAKGGTSLFLRSRYWSCFFIMPFAVGFTFLVIDFLMALHYQWFSTMWGVYLFAGAALSSMALLIIIITSLKHFGYLKVVNQEHYHLMGKLLFAFCVFWAYISFSQYFLIWYANITEETQFFLLRNSSGWNWVSTILVIGHFFIPFIILLWRPVKKSPAAISAVCVWILLMHVVDLYWIIIPERGVSLTAASGDIRLWFPDAWLLDLLALVGVGGVVTFVFLTLLQKSSLYPCQDPRLEESLNATN